MTKLISYHRITLSILFISLLIFITCEKKEDVVIEEKPDQIEAETSISNDQCMEEKSEREENLDKLLELVLEKEKELKAKEKNLEVKLAELEAKEVQLNELDAELKKAESKFKNFRLITYVFLIIGLACILTGLLMITFRKSQKPATSVPEVKPEKKVRKATTPKSGGESKAAKKKSPKSVSKTKKTAADKKSNK